MSENKKPGDNMFEDGSPEDRSPEDRSPEKRSPEDRSAEDRSAEDRSAEDRSPSDRSPSDRSAKDRSPEDRSAEDRSAEVKGPADRRTPTSEEDDPKPMDPPTSEKAEPKPKDPEYIEYLLSSIDIFSTFCVVGPDKEIIGVEQNMLGAHSPVIRDLIKQSKDQQEEALIDFSDVSLETFKNLLRYVYGYNNLCMLYFYECYDLLQLAHKYQMKHLKDDVNFTLLKYLNPENIWEFINHPLDLYSWSLKGAISNTIAFRIKQIIASEKFTYLNLGGLRTILEYNDLAKFELWEAVKKWASNIVVDEAGDNEQMKKTLVNQKLKEREHIQLFTMSRDEIYKEVLPLVVLTADQFLNMGMGVATGETPDPIDGFSRLCEPRKTPTLCELEVPDICIDIKLDRYSLKSAACIVPKVNIEPVSVTFYALRRSHLKSYRCECRIDILEFTEEEYVCLETIHFDESVEYSKPLTVPLTDVIGKLKFYAGFQYVIDVEFTQEHRLACHEAEWILEDDSISCFDTDLVASIEINKKISRTLNKKINETIELKNYHINKFTYVKF